jgi:hypothetical protein
VGQLGDALAAGHAEKARDGFATLHDQPRIDEAYAALAELG